MDLAYDSLVRLPDLTNCLNISSESGPAELGGDLASGAQGKTGLLLPGVPGIPSPMGLCLCDMWKEQKPPTIPPETQVVGQNEQQVAVS
jgi:hypothetical protein